MTDKETLLKLLGEYDAAMERLRQERTERDGLSTRALSRQLSYLEYRALELQTRLSLLDLDVRESLAARSSDGRPDAARQGSLWARLNPWHASFGIWAYVAMWALFMLIATTCAFIATFVPW